MEQCLFVVRAFLRARAFVAAVAWLPALAAPAGAALEPELAARLQQFAAAQGAAPSRRVEVQVGALDPRLRLAPCGRVEPFLPPGTRLWGRSRVGMRCTDGSARWSVFLPVTVRVFGPALVARAALPAGSVLTAADLAQAEVDLAEEPSMAMVETAMLVDRTLARPVQAGQAVRRAHLRARQWFAAGDTVQVSAVGSGFRIAGTGQALTPGVEGQPARVRTESGRILTGAAVAERRVEVPL
jgi:flagella basal body P-ring formation protein FlgA